MIDFKIIELIVNTYGKEPQVLQSIEEMSELTKELLKNINRGKSNEKEITDEIADVMIMISQLLIIYKIDDEELLEAIKQKIDRQKERIEKGE